MSSKQAGGVTTVPDRWRPGRLAPATGRTGLLGWAATTDHKRIAILTFATALGLMLVFSGLAFTMRAQLAVPNNDILSAHVYDEFFTIHGSGMIYLGITPLAMALGVYLVPLQVGAPAIAAPRICLAGYWCYVAGALLILGGFLTQGGAASNGWYAYTPLSTETYSPGRGMFLWIAGVFIAGLGMIFMAGCTLWTALRRRAPEMGLFQMPLMTWSNVVTTMMVVASFPSLLAAMTMLGIGRFEPQLYQHNLWNLAYEIIFWFYGHPVVYVMFFPFTGIVMEVIAVFSRRRSFGYKVTVFALLAFGALSMTVYGHHLFTTGQVTNPYFSFTSTLLIAPAGMEYFGFFATLIGGKIRFTTAMLFALTFLPQFFVGGATGVMLASPVFDYQANLSYFVVAHFHYTLLAGSVFGFMAGLYYWFPKVTGVMLRESIGKAHWALMTIGTNLTFLPMFFLGLDGMPRNISTYPASAGWSTLNLISSIGAGILLLSILALLTNLVVSLRHRRPAPANPWQAFTLEWATSSPPPRLNFEGPMPPIRTFLPLLDLMEEREGRPSADRPRAEPPAGAPPTEAT